jgi:hypothetical protein
VLAFLCGTALWALVPVTLHITSERTGAGTSQKTEGRVLGFAHSYGATLPVFFAPVRLAAQPSARISFVPLCSSRPSILSTLCVMRGLSKRASRTTRRGHSQGVSTIEVVHEQAAVALALDEVVSTSCASGATSFIRERTPSDPLEYPSQWKSVVVLTPKLPYPSPLRR